MSVEKPLPLTQPLPQNKNSGFDENHLVSTETIAGQAPAWDREMMFEIESLGVPAQSFEALVRSNLCGVDDQEIGL
ncbi:hypothetical protein HGM15179_015661 [Zosterops borbonicus]|uniref:Uncharacterized protein n=1 Tax=Zosterops borbonicus TaxID=364589 RepID=A0A8K1G4A4_9PASS|nr:hypothetical protein HGM15179_015661 [Zosterops borbonicus]